MGVIAKLLCSFFLVLLTLFNAYVLFINSTNHTGLPIRELEVFMFISGVISALVSKVAKERSWLIVSLIACLFFVNLLVFDGLEIMMNHGDWAKGGGGERYRACWFLNCGE